MFRHFFAGLFKSVPKAEINIINLSDNSVKVYSSYNEAIRELSKDADKNKVCIEKLRELNKQYKEHSGAGAVRITEEGKIIEYNSVEAMKRDLKK